MVDEKGEERAKKLRDEIDKITGRVPRGKDEVVNKSPHERVEERMRELDRDPDGSEKPSTRK